MVNKTVQNSILERLGLDGVEVTPFTSKWLECALSDENCPVLSSMINHFHIKQLNMLTKDQMQILSSIPHNYLDVDENFTDVIASSNSNPMHIAMALIGYKNVQDKNSVYRVNEDALILTTDIETTDLLSHFDDGANYFVMGSTSRVC